MGFTCRRGSSGRPGSGAEAAQSAGGGYSEYEEAAGLDADFEEGDELDLGDACEDFDDFDDDEQDGKLKSAGLMDNGLCMMVSSHLCAAAASCAVCW